MDNQDTKEPASKAEENTHEEAKKEEAKKEDVKKEEVKKFEEGMPISQFVKKEFVDELMVMGFSKAVSEKALYLTGGLNTDKAIEWIEQHQQDPDYEEELRIVGQSEEGQAKSKLTPEEARKKARELQEQIRKAQEERKKKEEEEREKQRIQSTKALQESREKIEEMATIREAERRRKEKRDLELQKQEMALLLAKDREERFGTKAGAGPVPGKPGVPEKTPLEKAQIAIKTIDMLYPEEIYPDIGPNCKKLLKAYLGNLAKDPENPKFRKINKENKAFKEKVADVKGGLAFLKAAGFHEKATTLDIEQVDLPVLQSILALLP